MDFLKYQSLAKLGNIEVDGILKGTVSLFSKLDGANGSVWFDGKNVKCSSRNRVLSLEDDNRGFAKWVNANKDQFLSLFEIDPSYRIFGEWLIPHTFKEYRDNSWNNFYIFDIQKGNFPEVKYLNYKETVLLLSNTRLSCIPEITQLENPSQDTIISWLSKSNYLCKDYKSTGEGLVVKNYDFKNKFGRVTWAKVISEEFYSGKKNLKEVKSKRERSDIESLFIEKGVTHALIEKEKSKLGVWDEKLIPKLLGIVFHCFLTEELPSLIVKHKYPKVDFNLLKKLSRDKIITYLGV